MMNMVGLEEREEQQVQHAAPSTKAREAYFLEFARAMQQVVTVPLMVTGGFRTKAAMEYALASGGADLIGIGRPLCVMTDGAKQLLDGTIDALPRYEDDRDILPRWLTFLNRIPLVKLVNSFANIFWYYEQLESLGQTGTTLSNLGSLTALQRTEARGDKLLAARTKGVTVSVVTKSSDQTKNGSWAAVAGIAAAAVGTAYLMCQTTV